MNEEKSKNSDQKNISIQSSIFLHVNQLSEQTEKLNRLVSNSTFSQLASHSLEASRLVAASELTKRISEQSKEMSRLISASTLGDTFSQLAKLSLEANRLVSSTGIADIKSQLAMTSSLARALNIESLTQYSLNRLKLDGLGKSLLISKTIQVSILENFNQLSNAYSRLVRARDDNFFGDLPKELTLEQPALEVLESTSFLEIISDPTLDEQFEIEKNLSRNEILAKIGGVEELLLEIDKGLLTMWRGAIEALESGHEDYARHCSVSLRELLTHIIHKLSPDDEIQEWATDLKLFENGRPTRKARLLFICRAVNHDGFVDFITKDIAATIEFFTLFQRGTHQINIPYTHKQLLTLKNKVESTISFLIQTYRLNSQN